MARLTLDSPTNLDPRQVADVELLNFTVDVRGGSVTLNLMALDSNGDALGTFSEQFATGAAQTYSANQGQTVLDWYKQRKGYTGTIT